MIAINAAGAGALDDIGHGATTRSGTYLRGGSRCDFGILPRFASTTHARPHDLRSCRQSTFLRMSNRLEVVQGDPSRAVGNVKSLKDFLRRLAGWM